MKTLKMILLGATALLMLGTTGCVIHEHRGRAEIYERDYHHGYYHHDHEGDVDVHLRAP